MSADLILNPGEWRDGCEACAKEGRVDCQWPLLDIVNGRCSRCGHRDHEHGVAYLRTIPVVRYSPVPEPHA